MIRAVNEPNEKGLDAPDAAERRRLWQTLNPLHRKYVYILARALAARQQKTRLAEDVYRELAKHVEVIERLLSTLAPRLKNISRPQPARTVDSEEFLP